MKRLMCLVALIVMAATAQAATYDELKIALGSQPLKDKVHVSILISVDKVVRSTDVGPGFDPTNHTNRVIWARRVMSNPGGAPAAAAQFFPVLIASNSDSPISVIMGASDASIQSQVDAMVDLFAYDGGP